MKKILIGTILIAALTGCKSDSDSPDLRTEMVFSKANGEMTQEFEYGETIYAEVYIINQDKLETAVMTYWDCEPFDMAVKDENEETLWTERDLAYGCSATEHETIIYPQERLKVFESKLEYLDESSQSMQDLILEPGAYHVDIELVEDYSGFSTKDLTILPPPTTQ